MDEENQKIAAQTELLIRIDERTRNFGKDITDIRVAMVTRKEFEDFQTSVKESLKLYATKDEIKPIRLIAYGAIGTIATAVLLALVAMAMQGSIT